MLKWRLVSLITAILLLVSGMTIPANAAEYIYDNLNRLTSVTYDNGQKIEYQYDAGGNLVNVTHSDIGAPKVISTDPADGAVDVESNKVITVTFNETVLEDINLASISITNTVDNTTVNYDPSINNNVLNLTPVEELSFNTAYSVNIPVGAVKDAAGNAFANQYAFSFTTGADLVVPTVTIISPVNNGIITGPVEIVADATDNVGVTKLEFYVNNLKAGERLVEPWVYQWDPPLGDYTLTAKAYDAAGNAATSAAVFVQRRANVTINNPADGVTIGGIINSFTAISDEPLTGNVELYIDGAYKQNVALLLEPTLPAASYAFALKV